MSLGKLPGIKGLVSGTHAKRRFKSDLSVDMISPPLGDFRHTMHVGRGGDVFGDTSFLSNHGGAGANGDGGPGSPDSLPSGSKTTGFFSRTLRHVRKTPVPRARGGSRDFSPPPPPISPIIKNAISLPQLNMDMSNGCLQRVLFPSSVSSPEDSLYTYGLQSGFVTLPRHSRLDRQIQDTSGTFSPDFRRGFLTDDGVGGFALTRSDSLASFTIDLGPSLMSEVLGLIDSPRSVLGTNYSWDEGEEEEEPSSVFEMAVESPSMHSTPGSAEDSSFAGNLNGKGRHSSSPEWAEPQEGEEEDGDEDILKRATPDASMGSLVRVEPGMEAERFQQAADVLARHYGGGLLLKGQWQSEDEQYSSLSHGQRRAPHAFAEEEEEIKV